MCKDCSQVKPNRHAHLSVPASNLKGLYGIQKCVLMTTIFSKGVFTQNIIFVSHLVARQLPTKLGPIQTVSDAVVQHVVRHKNNVFM
jgi:hypothetical protein